MSLKHSYSLLAPFYDKIVARATEKMRIESIRHLTDTENKSILLAGVGTGLDFPWLPTDASYTGMDMTFAMLQRARTRIPENSDIRLHIGNVMQMPYAASRFDVVVMHLILAVVPVPELALREAVRVLKPGGYILILDKFLRPGQLAPARRLLNLLLRHVATRTDVVFEELLEQIPGIRVDIDHPVPPTRWFRQIKLNKALN